MRITIDTANDDIRETIDDIECAADRYGRRRSRLGENYRNLDTAEYTEAREAAHRMGLLATALRKMEDEWGQV